jgi:hypothetical protein
MSFEEELAVYSENHSNSINSLYHQDSNFVNVIARGTYRYE